MVRVWRLSPAAFAETLDGEGNRIFGARWNSPGRGVVYACQNLSLCVLETYVHFAPAQRETIPDFEAVQIAIPDDAGSMRVSVEEFNDSLSSGDPLSMFRKIGDSWLTLASDLILVAPSVIVPEETNVMLNPAHPRMSDVAVVSRRRFQFDPRLSVMRS